jgi:hypothetical protein
VEAKEGTCTAMNEQWRGGERSDTLIDTYNKMKLQLVTGIEKGDWGIEFA